MAKQTPPQPEQGANNEKLAYLTGVLTTGVVFSLLLFLLVYLVGGSVVAQKLRERMPGYNPAAEVISIPEDVLAELTDLRAVVSNTDNPTRQPFHDTILVHPDPLFGYALNADTSIYGDLLRTRMAFNIDPPFLYRTQPLETLSAQLQDYIEEQSRLSFSYRIDAQGHRQTLPLVASERKLLVVGDSVAFGVGVDDADTAASQLQAALGDGYKVVNIGVGGYTGHQAFTMAEKLSGEEHFAGMIYIACQNDFVYSKDANAEMRDVLGKFQSIADRFDYPPVVVLETYLEYSLQDFFVDGGWGNAKLRETDELRVATRKFAADIGFTYGDWADVVTDFRSRERAPFSPFALYVDHTHLSPRGNGLMAGLLLSLMRQGSYPLPPPSLDGPGKPL